MSVTQFGKESTLSAAGANTQAGFRAGFQPATDGDLSSLVSKRSVILTENGWVERVNKKNDGSTTNRQIDSVIVAAHPGQTNRLSYQSNTYSFKPEISQIYIKLNANGNISANVSANLYVVFNTPISFRASGNNLTFTLANTTSGNHAVAIFANTASTRIINANNTLVFRMPKLRAGANGSGKNTAIYQINAQSIAVTGGGHSIYNPDQGKARSANLVLTGAVSNAISNGLGQKLASKRFTVKVNG